MGLGWQQGKVGGKGEKESKTVSQKARMKKKMDYL